MDPVARQIRDECNKELEGKTPEEITAIMKQAYSDFQKRTGIILEEYIPKKPLPKKLKDRKS